MSNFELLAHFDVAQLSEQLKTKSHLFGEFAHRASPAQSPHKSMSDIWVRYNHIDNFGANFNDEHDAVWYPSYFQLPELRPIIFDLMRFVEGERLGGVLITKLPPGGVIKTHVDAGWHADFYEKFYIAIDNKDGAIFTFPDGSIQAKSGECYWFDNSVPHGVENNSDGDRLALIVCIKTRHFTHKKP